MARLKTWQINLFGFLMALIVSGILFYFMIKPKQESLETVKGEVTSIQGAGGTEQAVAGKRKDADNAEVASRKVQADWRRSASRYMPTLNLGPDVFRAWQYNGYYDIDSGRRYGYKDTPTIWGKWVSAWYDAQRNAGVARTPGMAFDIPPVENTPNAVSRVHNITFPEAAKPWIVTLNARSFRDAIAHLNKINSMQHHGMPVINNVSMNGQSPNLTLAYELALYVVTEKDPPPADPFYEAAIGSATPGGPASPYGNSYGGGPGGPPPGFGGPPPGFGGPPPGVGGPPRGKGRGGE